MNIATLTIEMAANVARLQQDMQRATSVVDNATAQMRKAAGMAGAALGAIGVGLSASVFSGWIKGAIDAADEASKLAQKAGLAVKDVAGLTLAFEQSGMTAGDVSGAMSKLSRSMAEGNKAFAAMGLTAQNNDGTLKSTRQMLGEVADKFAGYADGAGKTALAMEVFGKSGAEMIPLLNGGATALNDFDATAQKLGLTLDEDAAKAAEKFNDEIYLLTKRSQGAATQIMKELLPALTAISEEMAIGAKNGGSLSLAGTGLSIVFETLAVLGSDIVFVLRMASGEISTIAKQAKALISGDLEGFSKIGSDWIAESTKARADLDSFQRRVMSARDVAASLKGASDYDEPRFRRAMGGYDDAAKKVAPTIKGVGRAASAAVGEFEKLNAKLSGDVTKGYADAEAATNGYNKAQQRALEIFASPAWAAFTGTQREQISALLEQAIKAEQAKDAAKALADTQKAAHEAYAALMKGYADSAASVEKRIADMQNEAAALELSERLQISLAQAIEYTTIARLREQQTAAMGNEDAVLGIQAEIDAREKLIGELGKKEYKEQIKVNKAAADKAEVEWSNTWQSVSQGFVSAMMQGGDSLKKWLIDTFAKLVLQPIISPQGGESGWSAWASKIGSYIGSSSNDTETKAAEKGMGMVSSAGGDSGSSSGGGMASYAGWIGMIYSAFQMASKHYDQGYNQETLKESKAYRYSYERATYAMLKSIGVSEKWASILSGGNHMSFLYGKKLKGGGPVGNFNADGTVTGQQYKYYKGGLLASSKTEYTDMTGKSGKEWTTKLTNFRDGMAAMVQALGLSGDSIKRFAGQLKVDIAGLSDEDAMKKIESDLMAMRESMAATVPGLEKFAEAGETAGQAFIRLYTETQAALEQAGITSEAIADVIVGGMTGRLTQAQVGEQLSDIIIGGIYNTIAGGFAKQISDVFMTQIMDPVMIAITAGVPLSQAISQSAIDKVVETAQKAAEAMKVIFENEAFLAAMDQIRTTISSISITTADAAPYVNSFTSAVDNSGQAAEDAAQRVRDAWRDMGDTLTDEIRRIKGEIVGDTSGGLAYTQAQFAIATAQARAGNMDAAAMLPELSRALIELAKNSAGSLSDLRVMQGSTASSLIETRRILSQQYGFDVPAYANGGNHPGGWALVGEQGPELVNMPSATVYTNANSKSMLDNTALVAEVRALRAEVVSLRESASSIDRSTKNFDRNFERVTQGGEVMLTDAA